MRVLGKLSVVLVGLLLVACGRQQVATVAGSDSPSQARAASAAQISADALTLRYLANEGFMVRKGEFGVLIDGLFSSGVIGYQTLPENLRESLESGADGGGAIQVALASHYHPDHFEPAAVGRFLTANPEAVFVSTPQAADSFRSTHPERADLQRRFHAVLPEPGTVVSLTFDGIRVDAINLHHGRRNPPVENLGFVVTIGDERFIHFGDTEAKMEDFEPYLNLLAEPDLALLPFWFLSSEWRAEMVRTLIRPGFIVCAHLPTPDAPASHFARWNSYSELRATIEDSFPEAWIPSRPGSRRPSDEPGPPPSIVID